MILWYLLPIFFSFYFFTFPQLNLFVSGIEVQFFLLYYPSIFNAQSNSNTYLNVCRIITTSKYTKIYYYRYLGESYLKILENLIIVLKKNVLLIIRHQKLFSSYVPNLKRFDICII